MVAFVIVLNDNPKLSGFGERCNRFLKKNKLARCGNSKNAARLNSTLLAQHEEKIVWQPWLSRDLDSMSWFLPFT